MNKAHNKAKINLTAQAVAVAVVFMAVTAARAQISSISNTPDPFDNQVAGQTSYLQATPNSGASAFPNRGGFLVDKWDLTLDLFNSGGTFARRLYAEYNNS